MRPHTPDLTIAHYDRNILHIGCTTYPNLLARMEDNNLLHDKLLEVSSSIVGLDIDAEGIEIMRNYYPEAELVIGDAHDLENSFGNRKFDLIIAGDVIEHLQNPGTFLKSCHNQLATGGSILVTTANAYNIGRYLKALLFHEAVHPDHTAYYSPKTLQRMGQLSGLQTKEYGYYACEPLVGPFSVKWANRAVTNFIENSATLIWPQLSEGVIVVYNSRTDITNLPL